MIANDTNFSKEELQFLSFLHTFSEELHDLAKEMLKTRNIAYIKKAISRCLDEIDRQNASIN